MILFQACYNMEETSFCKGFSKKNTNNEFNSKYNMYCRQTNDRIENYLILKAHE